MAQTREDLTRKLEALKGRLIGTEGASHGGANTDMAKKTSSKSSSAPASGGKASVKKTPVKKAAPGAAKAKSSGAKSDSSSSASKASAPKKAAAAKGGRATAKKATTKRVVKGVAAKTTEVLGEMLAGAAVGAITGAANEVKDEPTAAQRSVAAVKRGTAVKKSSGKRTATPPGEVLSDLATGAAIGAVAGAAKAVMPSEESKGSKGKGRKK